MSLCIITTGPASTRIDDVRRITNFSTGELGTLLAESLVSEGHRVILLRGFGSTFRMPENVDVKTFFSNDDLWKMLVALSSSESVSSVFHAAALTDFEIASVRGRNGENLDADKISSSVAEINICLRPARKLVRELRQLFPNAKIVGWKYELNGTPAEAVHKAQTQIDLCRIDACVVNGKAWGNGFAYLTKTESTDFLDKAALVDFLAG